MCTQNVQYAYTLPAPQCTIPFYITAEKINSSLFSYYYVAYFNKVSSTLIYDKIYY